MQHMRLPPMLTLLPPLLCVLFSCIQIPCDSYDDDIIARLRVDHLVNAQAEAVLAVGFAGQPRQLLQLLGVNMSSAAAARANALHAFESPMPARWEHVAVVSCAMACCYCFSLVHHVSLL